MVDDTPEDTQLPPDSGRARREPPTIDLEANEVMTATGNASGDAPSEKLAAAVSDLKSPPGEASAAPDLAAINERLGQLERAARAQQAAPENARPADDLPLRRVVAAALLDVSVRQGDPFAAALVA